jgi:hypothetical protein
LWVDARIQVIFFMRQVSRMLTATDGLLSDHRVLIRSLVQGECELLAPLSEDCELRTR